VTRRSGKRRRSGLNRPTRCYVGPRASLTFAPSQSDYFLDLDYFHEIARRYQIQTEQPLPPPKISETPSSPRYVNH